MHHQSPNRRDAGRRRARAARLAVLAASLFPAAAVFGQVRIANYNVAQLQGNGANLEDVFAAMHNDDKPGFAVPVGVFVFQEVLSTNVATLQMWINNAAPPGVTYALGTYTNTNEDDYGGAQAMFYRTDLLTEIPSAHVDIYTGAGRRSDRWKLQLVGYTSPAASFYVYSSHLKSDTGTANQNERLTGAMNIRANADALGAGVNVIYAGDYNLYSNSEPAYQHFLATGNGQAVDPLGSGSWSGSGNAIKHTQSPRVTSANGLVGGGLDDRFDFQLSVAALHDFAGLSMMGVPFVYRSLGNDGNHYNLDINSGNNSYYPTQPAASNALAADLHDASDHVPVLADYQVPAMMAADMPSTFGHVIQGAAYSVAVEVTNPAPVVIALGGDVLDFTAAGSLALSGVQTGSVEPLGDAAIVHLPLNTTTIGNVTARATLTSSSQGVQPTALTRDSTGTIVRHANASFSDSQNIDATTVTMTFHPGSGTHLIAVPIYNFGYNAVQALLDVDGVSAVSAPFAFAGGLTGNVGTTPATLTFQFNTQGFSAGVYQAHASINVSDENLPGATNAILTLTLNVTITPDSNCQPDITGDGLVNINDLLSVIVGWGTCPAPPQPCVSDVNHDGVVNVDDLLAVFAGWGACP